MSTLSMKLLGPPTVEVAGKSVSHFRSVKEVGLLAYLAVETTTHPRESLITLLWPDQTTLSARRNLSQTLSRLRRDLEDLSNDSIYFESTRQTLRLLPEAPIQCDLWQIDHVLTACSQHKHESLAQCPVCQAQLRQAAELTGGELLEGFTVPDSPTFEEWLLLAREFWFERQMGLLDHVTNGAMATGQHADAVRYARQQLALEPWRERAHHQIIQALALNGERAAAIAQFDTCARVLDAELGLSPSPATRSLVERIRAGTFPDAPETRLIVPPREETHTPSNLPHRLTPFFGREDALRQMTEQLQREEYRLLTIAGPGGIGKTRFALEVASHQMEHFADGVYWVPLAGTGRADDIPNAVAAALALPLNPHLTPAEQVVRFLRKRHMLLVLDNFEHLTDGAEWLLTLLEQTQRVTLLVTSRERLHMLAEGLFPLRGLPLPPLDASIEQAAAFASVRLFIDRARRFNKGFRLDPDNLPSVTRICHLVEGVPLGIELATTWSREFSCAEIAASISHSLDFIATTLRDLPARHRSLRAVFDHSWRASVGGGAGGAFPDFPFPGRLLPDSGGGCGRRVAPRPGSAALQIAAGTHRGWVDGDARVGAPIFRRKVAARSCPAPPHGRETCDVLPRPGCLCRLRWYSQQQRVTGPPANPRQHLCGMAVGAEERQGRPAHARGNRHDTATLRE